MRRSFCFEKNTFGIRTMRDPSYGYIIITLKEQLNVNSKIKLYTQSLCVPALSLTSFIIFCCDPAVRKILLCSGNIWLKGCVCQYIRAFMDCFVETAILRVMFRSDTFAGFFKNDITVKLSVRASPDQTKLMGLSQRA